MFSFYNLSPINMTTQSDDYSSDNSTSGSIAVGGTVNGVIEQGYDRDWFKVSLTANVTYQFALSGAHGSAFLSTYAPNLSIGNSTYSSAVHADVIQAGTASMPAIWFKPSTSGDYFVSVNGAYDPATYTLNASSLGADDFVDGTVGNTTLALGGRVSGSLELSSDWDVFAINLDAGKTYTLSASGAADANGLKALPLTGFYTNNGGGLANVSYYITDSISVSFTPTMSGSYYAVAHDVNQFHGTGGYTLALTAAPDDYAANASGAGTLVPDGQAAAGKLDVSNDIDWFKVSLSANQSYTFTLAEGSNQTSISIVDAQGTLLGNNSAGVSGVGQVMTWTPPRAGDYYVQVKAGSYYADGGTFTGAYTVQATRSALDDYSANVSTTGLLLPGTTLKGHIETLNDVDWIKVRMQAGSDYAFDLSAATLAGGDTKPMQNIVLYSAMGVSLNTFSASRAKDQVLSYHATSTGDYFLAVSASYGTTSASYSITSYANQIDDVKGDVSTTATLAAGAVVHSSINFIGDHDWYRVDLGAGSITTFAVDGVLNQGGTLGSSGDAPSLAIYNSAGVLLTSNIGYANSYDPTIGYYAQAGGSYYVEVTSSALGTGTYTLSESGANGQLPDTRPPFFDRISAPVQVGQAAANIDLFYRELIVLGSGTIKLSTADGVVVESFDAASSTHLHVSGYGLSIDPSADLLPNTDYVVEIGAGIIKDVAGNVNQVVTKQTFHTADVPLNQVGTSGNDVFHAGASGGTIDGGDGIDTVIIAGNSYAMNSTQSLLSTQITGNWGTGVVHILSSIERVQFNDTAVAYDVRGTAGQLFGLYQAAFGRTPDATGFGFWLAQADKGESLHNIATGFATSTEFTKLYGATPTDAELLTRLYLNVLHRAPDQGGFDFWSAQLHNGASEADLLVAFTLSDENQITLSPSIQSGIHYTPFL